MIYESNCLLPVCNQAKLFSCEFKNTSRITCFCFLWWITNAIEKWVLQKNTSSLIVYKLVLSRCVNSMEHINHYLRQIKEFFFYFVISSTTFLLFWNVRLLSLSISFLRCIFFNRPPISLDTMWKRKRVRIYNFFLNIFAKTPMYSMYSKIHQYHIIAEYNIKI